jgi:hypothetical protein
MAKIILIAEKPETISSKIRNETRVPLSPLLFNIVLKFLAREIRQEEVIKGIQTGKETVKISLFADDMIVYLQDPKKLYPKTPRHHKQLQKCSRMQNQLHKSVAFLYNNHEQIKNNI